MWGQDVTVLVHLAPYIAVALNIRAQPKNGRDLLKNSSMAHTRSSVAACFVSAIGIHALEQRYPPVTFAWDGLTRACVRQLENPRFRGLWNRVGLGGVSGNIFRVGGLVRPDIFSKKLFLSNMLEFRGAVEIEQLSVRLASAFFICAACRRKKAKVHALFYLSHV